MIVFASIASLRKPRSDRMIRRIPYFVVDHHLEVGHGHWMIDWESAVVKYPWYIPSGSRQTMTLWTFAAFVMVRYDNSFINHHILSRINVHRDLEEYQMHRLHRNNLADVNATVNVKSQTRFLVPTLGLCSVVTVWCRHSVRNSLRRLSVTNAGSDTACSERTGNVEARVEKNVENKRSACCSLYNIMVSNAQKREGVIMQCLPRFDDSSM